MEKNITFVCLFPPSQSPVGVFLPPIVRECFLLDTSDSVHCCTAIPQQPVVMCFTKPLTACAPFEIQVLLPTSFMKEMFYSQRR